MVFLQLCINGLVKATSCLNMTVFSCISTAPLRYVFPSLGWKNPKGLFGDLTSTTSNTFETNWNADCSQYPQPRSEGQHITVLFSNQLSHVMPIFLASVLFLRLLGWGLKSEARNKIYKLIKKRQGLSLVCLLIHQRQSQREE